MAFVSGDKLVREAVQSRLDDRCTCYETIEEFETFLKLSEEELTNEFVRAILTRARKKFHSEKNPECLLYRDELISKIKDEFSVKLLPPLANLPTPGLLSSAFTTTSRWEPITSERVWIRAPQFVSLEGQNEYHWTSRVIFIQLFKYEGSRTGGLLGGYTEPGDEKFRKVEFPVNWKSRVARNGSFRSLEFEDFGESETIFEPITDADRGHYGIEREERESS